jgi:hypothetical protein
LNQGDIWFDTDDGNKQYYYTGSAWVSVQDNAILTAQATADSKIKTFYQTTAPTATGLGDVWFDTDEGNKQYRWSGSAWLSVQDTAIVAAATAAQAASDAAAAADLAADAAQATADNKNKIYRQTTMPTTGPFSEGDLWFDTDDDNRFYRYTSGAFSSFSLGNNAIANLSATKLTAGTIDASVITVSNINAGNISTGTLAADRILAASITGAKIAAGTITASNILAGTITATQIATGTITATQIAASTITGSLIAAGTITATNIAANTITASQIAAATITATQIAAGTITTDKLVAGTLTGYTVQTSEGGSGSNAVKLVGSTNSLSFMLNGSYVGHLLNLSSSGILMHLGATANTTAGASYPYQYLSSGTLFMASNSTTSISLSSTIGYSASLHDFYGNLTTNGSSSITASGELFAAGHQTTGNAANGYVFMTGGRIARFSSSSERYKENIVDLKDVPELDPRKMLDLKVRAFSYKENYLKNDDRTGVLIPGLIAEEVDAIYPLAVDYDNGQIENIHDRAILVSLLVLVQDLYKEVQTLKGE